MGTQGGDPRGIEGSLQSPGAEVDQSLEEAG